MWVILAEKEGFARRHWGSAAAQPGELKNHSLDGFFPATGGPFPSHPSFFYAARKRDRKCDLFFVAYRPNLDIRGHTFKLNQPANKGLPKMQRITAYSHLFVTF